MLTWLNRQPPAAAVVILAGLALLVMAPGLWHGAIITHSSLFNTVWAEGFAAELAKGHLYPRYLPLVNDGLGSPAFYFYAPLPFYLAAPFVWLTGNAGLAVVIASTLMLALSGLAALLLLRDLAGPRHALALALLYMLLPYHLVVDIWVRGAFGEQAAFLFLPLALLCLNRMAGDGRYAAGLALATAGQVLSHLPSTLIYGAILAGFSLWTARRHRSWRLLALAATAGLLGVIAAAIYLGPAQAGRAFISPQFWGAYLPQDYHLAQLERPFDVIMLLAVLPQAVTLALAGRFLWRHDGWTDGLPWIALGTAVLFFVSPLASPFWAHAGPLQIIQFPWRMVLGLELAGVVLLAMLAARDSGDARRLARLLGVTVLVSGALCAILRHGSDPNRGTPLRAAELFEAERLALKADALEYLPPCTVVADSETKGPLSTALLLEHKRAAPQPAGTFRSFHYPFLEFSSGGNVIPTHCHKPSGLAAPDGGLMPEGPVTVTARPLPVERPAAWLSLLGAMGIALLYLWGRGRRIAPPA
jgi:hypothetical protein